MRQGRITAWGTPSSGGPEKRIDAEEWSNLEIAFDDEELTSIPYPFGGVNQLAAALISHQTQARRFGSDQLCANKRQ
jgi:hypothetical protein